MSKDSELVALICQQGSGSNMLRSFLNSNKNVFFYDEVFCKPNPDHNWKVYDRRTDGKVADFFKRLKDGRKEGIVGVDIKYNHLFPELVEYLQKNNVKVIHLKRDPVRTFFQPIIKDDQSFTLADVKKHCKFVRGQEKKIESLFSDCFNIRYEYITMGEEIYDFVEPYLQSYLDLDDDYFQLSDINIHKKTKIRL